jgi:hypothetical protein
MSRNCTAGAWNGGGGGHELSLEIEELQVRYVGAAAGRDVVRDFKYSLSRQDVERELLRGH